MESPGTYYIYIVQNPNRYLQYLRSYRPRKIWSWYQDSAGSVSGMCNLTLRCTSGESAEQISKAKCNSYSIGEVKESWELHNPDRWSWKIRMHDRHQILCRTHQDTSPNISWKNESCSTRIHKFCVWILDPKWIRPIYSMKERDLKIAVSVEICWPEYELQFRRDSETLGTVFTEL
jgi:hypothetical protein